MDYPNMELNTEMQKIILCVGAKICQMLELEKEAKFIRLYNFMQEGRVKSKLNGSRWQSRIEIQVSLVICGEQKIYRNLAFVKCNITVTFVGQIWSLFNYLSGGSQHEPSWLYKVYE
jgi:hypothetical protein